MLDYNSRMIMAQNAGHISSDFVREMGKEAEGTMTRAPFSTDLVDRRPAAKALDTPTDIPGDQLIMTWENVKFDATGQNTGVKGIILQLQGGAYHSVYPFDVATRDVIYPIPAWKDR